MLGRLLEEIDDDEALVEELYLRTLSREPTDKELKTALEFCAIDEEPIGRVRRPVLGTVEFVRVFASAVESISHREHRGHRVEDEQDE